MSSVKEETEVGSVEPQTTAATEAPGETGASVDKIRDIIFGSQIKNYEARFARLEQDLVRETAELKDLMRKRFESIESFFKAESEAMAARLRAEKEERATHVANVQRETKEAHGGLANHVNNVEAAMNEGHSSLRQESDDGVQKTSGRDRSAIRQPSLADGGAGIGTSYAEGGSIAPVRLVSRHCSAPG